MNNKKGLNFFLLIIVIIIGRKLYQHFDFQNFTFKQPAIDVLYLFAFIACSVFLIRDYFTKQEK